MGPAAMRAAYRLPRSNHTLIHVIAVGLVCMVIAVLVCRERAPAAIPPSAIDTAFADGDEKAVTDAVVSSAAFKQAVSEAVKARDANKADNKPIGMTPAQAARVRFIEVLQGK
jgi:hypothetical protein